MIGSAGRLLDRSLPVLAAVLVVAVASFFGYYLLDSRGGDSSPSLLDRNTERLEEAVQADPESAAARLALARAYEAAGRDDEALSQYEAALQLSPDNAAALLGIGRVLLERGEMNEAAASFQQVVDVRAEGEFAHVDASLQEARYYLGEIYIHRGDYEAAIEQLEGAVTIDSADADSWYKLCQANVGADKLEDAVDACRRAVLLVPDFAEPYEQLQIAYSQLGQDLQARYAEAMLLYAQDKHRDAAERLKEIIAEDPEYWDAYVGLGLALESSAQHEEAIAAYRRALDGDPENFLARLGLSRLGGGAP